MAQSAVHRPLDHVRLDELIVPKQCPWLKIGGKDIIAHQPLKIMAVARLLIGAVYIFMLCTSDEETHHAEHEYIHSSLPPPPIIAPAMAQREMDLNQVYISCRQMESSAGAQ